MGKITGKSKLKLKIAIFMFLMLSMAGSVNAASRDVELFDRGYGYYLSYQPDKAAETFRTFLNEFPQSSAKDAVMFWLGKSLMQMNSYEEAGKFFSALRQNFPESPFSEYALQELETIKKVKSGLEKPKPQNEASSSQSADEGENAVNFKLAVENKRTETLQTKMKELSEKKNEPGNLEEKAKELETAKKKSEDLQIKVKGLEDEKKKADELQVKIKELENEKQNAAELQA
jgi:hypothetical protein